MRERAKMIGSILVAPLLASVAMGQQQQAGVAFPEEKIGPRIRLVGSTVQRPSGQVVIAVEGLPFGAADVKVGPQVTFDGISAAIGDFRMYGQSNALITAIVPFSVGRTNAKPVIEVKIGKHRLTNSGDFTVLAGDTPDEKASAASRLEFIIKIAVGTLVLGAILALLAHALFRRRRLRVDVEQENLAPLKARELGNIRFPSVPTELRNALANRECIVVVGSGINAASGMKTWRELVGSIADDLDERNASNSRQLLQEGRVDDVVDSLASLFSRHVLGQRIVEKVRGDEPRRQVAYRALSKLPLSAIISLNFDNVIVESLAREDRAPKLFRAKDAERCLDAFSRDELFILKLNGSVDAPGEMLFSHQNLKDAVSTNDALRDLLGRLYYSRTLLFVGVSLNGVQNFFRLIDRITDSPKPHFALVEVMDDSWELISRNLDTHFGLKVLPFSFRNREKAIETFLGDASTGLEREASDLTGRAGRTKLTSIALNNIGPFSHCKLDLDPQWTVLLGDNGVGKSTILRAIAISYCGKASEPFAQRLLKSGTTSGDIRLRFGEREYVTTITARSGGGSVVGSPSGVPMELEGILAVGYSAVRTVSWQRKKEEARPSVQRPHTADLLPLVSDEPDPRLDGIKQWIVRIDHLRKGDSVDMHERQRYDTLFEDIFKVFRNMTKGVEIHPKRIDPETGEITIESRDGPIPFESLSQGTLSLISWVGALLQRLHEVAPSGVNPREVEAIVLIDEIDAHMHPSWQQTLVLRLREAFKNVQFIATSHSPLVVGGLEPRQVYRFQRDEEGLVQVQTPEHALKGLGAAGLLTSELFGLPSQLDIPTADALNHKRRLTAKVISGRITDGERVKLEQLEEQVGDLDLTSAVRDPMFKLFVEAMSKVQADEPETTVMELTPDERERKAKLAEDIVRKLKAGEEDLTL